MPTKHRGPPHASLDIHENLAQCAARLKIRTQEYNSLKEKYDVILSAYEFNRDKHFEYLGIAAERRDKLEKERLTSETLRQELKELKERNSRLEETALSQDKKFEAEKLKYTENLGFAMRKVNELNDSLSDQLRKAQKDLREAKSQISELVSSKEGAEKATQCSDANGSDSPSAQIRRIPTNSDKSAKNSKGRWYRVSKIFGNPLEPSLTIEDSFKKSGVESIAGFEWIYLNRDSAFETAKIFIPSTDRKLIFNCLKSNCIKVRAWYEAKRQLTDRSDRVFKKRMHLPATKNLTDSEILNLKNSIANKLHGKRNSFIDILRIEDFLLDDGRQIVVTFRINDDQALHFLYKLKMEDMATMDIINAFSLTWWKKNACRKVKKQKTRCYQA